MRQEKKIKASRRKKDGRTNNKFNMQSDRDSILIPFHETITKRTDRGSKIMSKIYKDVDGNEVPKHYAHWNAEDKKRGYHVYRHDGYETERDYDNAIVYESTTAYVTIQPEGFWHHCISMEITKDKFKFRVSSGSELGEFTYYEMWKSLERAMKASEQIRFDIKKELIATGDKINEEETQAWALERQRHEEERKAQHIKDAESAFPHLKKGGKK